MADDIPKPRSGLTSRIAKIASTDIKQLGTTKVVIIIAVFFICFFLVLGAVSFIVLSNALGTHPLENKEDVFRACISEKIPADVVILNGWGALHFGGDGAHAIFICSPETFDALVKELDMKDITQEFHKGRYTVGDEIKGFETERTPWWDLKYSKDLRVFEQELEKRSWKVFYYNNTDKKCYFDYRSTG